MEPTIQETEDQYKDAISSLAYADGDNVVMKLMPAVVDKFRANGYIIEDVDQAGHVNDDIDWDAATDNLVARGTYTKEKGEEIKKEMKQRHQNSIRLKEKYYRIVSKRWAENRNQQRQQADLYDTVACPQLDALCAETDISTIPSVTKEYKPQVDTSDSMPNLFLVGIKSIVIGLAAIASFIIAIGGLFFLYTYYGIPIPLFAKIVTGICLSGWLVYAIILIGEMVKYDKEHPYYGP